MSEELTEICQNCQRNIEKSALMLHTIHCQRNFFKCSCGEVVHKSEKENHEQEFHVQVKCKFCYQPFQKQEVEKHEYHCTMQPQLCQFCEAFISFVEYTHHVEMCGSRTQQCPNCKQHVLIKAWTQHQGIICKQQVEQSKQAEKLQQQKLQQQQKQLQNRNKTEKLIGQKRPSTGTIEESKVTKKQQIRPTQVSKVEVQQKQRIKAPLSVLKKKQELENKQKQEQALDKKLQLEKNMNNIQSQQKRKQQVIRSSNISQNAQLQVGSASQPIDIEDSSQHSNLQQSQDGNYQNSQEFGSNYHQNQFQEYVPYQEDSQLKQAIEQSIKDNKNYSNFPNNQQDPKDQDEQLAAALQASMYDGNNYEDPEIAQAILRSLNEN